MRKEMFEVILDHRLVYEDGSCTCEEMFYDTRLSRPQIIHEHALHLEMELMNEGYGDQETAWNRGVGYVAGLLNGEEYTRSFKKENPYGRK